MNICSVIENCNIAKDRIAMILKNNDGSKRIYSYREMFAEIVAFSEWLQYSGITNGKRVAIVAESCPEWSIAYLSIAKLKATAVLIDYSLPRNEILKLLEKSDCSCIFSSPKLLPCIEDVKDIPILNIMNHGEYFESCSCKVCQNAIFEGNEEVASIIFSSGTTKTAAGIMHSHDSIINSTKMCLNCNNIGGKDRFLAILPNSHIYGLYTQVIAPLICGTSVCFIESLNAECILGAFSDYQPTVFPAVPKVFELLKSQIEKKINSNNKTRNIFNMLFPICLKLRKASGINLGKLLFKSIQKGFGGKIRIMCSAGAPFDSKTAEFYYGIGFNLLITYGATETSIPTIGNYGKNLTTDSCGKPYPNIEMKLNDAGEIMIKSPYLMLGYFNDDQTTQEAYDDGWFHSGDLGAFDKKGNMKILGRCKENIVLATGKKVAPDDIESAYANILGVKELVICGIPTQDGSFDEVHAFVVAENAQTDIIIQQLKSKSSSLSQSMKLAGIHFVSQIPKTSLQKPQRYLLKQMVISKTLCKSESFDEKKLSLHDFIFKAVASVANVDISEIKIDTKIFEDLAIDSLSTIELSVEIEEFCGIIIDTQLHKAMTVAELIEMARNPVCSRKKEFNAELYPKKKRIVDYSLFQFYQSIVRKIYDVKIHNDRVLPENCGYIICANHVTNIDYLFLTLNFKKARFLNFCCMAKQELFNRNPLNKIFIQFAGLIPVDRTGNAASSLTSAKNKLKEKWGLLVHPEGTRSKDGKLGEFKKGAAMLAIEAGVPIVPAYIKGGHEVYPPSQKLPKLFDWKSHKKYCIEVIYGEPILPYGLSVDDLMQKVNLAVKSLSCLSKNVAESTY